MHSASWMNSLNHRTAREAPLRLFYSLEGEGIQNGFTVLNLTPEIWTHRHPWVWLSRAHSCGHRSGSQAPPPEVPAGWITGPQAESEGPYDSGQQSLIILNRVSKCCAFHVLFKGMLVIWYLLYLANERTGSHTGGHLAFEGGPGREKDLMCFLTGGKAIRNSLQCLLLFVFFLLTYTITIHLRLKIRRFSHVHGVHIPPHFLVS